LKKKQNRLANLINLTLVQSYDRSDSKETKEQNTNNHNHDTNNKSSSIVTCTSSPNRLRYYQGYHDVASVFLHALGGASTNPLTSPMAGGGAKDHYSSGDLELPSKVLCQVSFSHFTDALRSDFLRLQTGLKLILFPLLRKIDPEVHDHLMDADMEPFFCLSWILTWFAHDVRDTALVKRLFDAFLVAHPALPVYSALAMITHPHNRRLILETDCDFAALHQCLASLPKHSSRNKERHVDVDDVDGLLNANYGSDVDVDVDEEGGDCGASTGVGHGNLGGDNNTVNTNTDHTYLEEQSEFDDDDDDDSHTFDTRSNYTSETLYTESSFPTSIQSSNNYNASGSATPVGGAGGSKKATVTPGGTSLASGSLMSLQEDYQCPTDRTLISTEEPDFLSKESTLVSGTWNDPAGGGAQGGGSGGSNTANAGGFGDPENPIGACDGSNNDGYNNNMYGNNNAALLVGDKSPVPFESVLDTALLTMKKYPPSSLVTLAKTYFGDDWDSQLSLLATINTNTNNHRDDKTASKKGGNKNDLDVQRLIGLLRPTPPAWSILPTCTSDWLDKQKLRQDLGLKPTSRNDRRRRRSLRGVNTICFDIDAAASTPTAASEMAASAPTDASETTTKPEGAVGTTTTMSNPMEYVRLHPEKRAVVAIGCAPGLEAKKLQRQLLRKKRTRRKRQRALVIGCGVVLIGGLLYGAVNYNNGTNKQLPNQQPSLERNSENVHDAATADAATDAGVSENVYNAAASSASDDLESTARALSAEETTSDSEEADAMRKAANIILPRLENLGGPPKNQEPMEPPPSFLTKPNSPISVSSVLPKIPESKTSGLRSPTVVSTASPSSTPTSLLRSPTAAPSPSLVVRSKAGDRNPSLTPAHGTSIIINILSHTKALTFRFFRNTWNVCRGFFLRFHFSQRRDQES